MKKFYDVQAEEEKKTRAWLVGLPLLENPSGLAELQGLIWTLGMEEAGQTILSRLDVQPAYGMGSGKAKEIRDAALLAQADCIIMDWELDPTKQRNWEKLCGVPVFDRQEVIIRIFASRAQTREAVLQVELARLEYSLPRLAHMYGDLARQRGGNYGAKGSGEKQLELDRRQTRLKIQQVKEELKKVRQNRATQRKRRQKIPLPALALCGYTNAGKSSLLNALTGSDALVENKLFATLDPLTRRMKCQASEILLTDTVGFISNLPHQLIDAFKSTLEEAALADALLIVLDSSDPNALEEAATVLKVLEQIGAGQKPRLVVLNKIDALESPGGEGSERLLVQLAALKERFPDALEASAKSGAGLDLIKRKISDIIKKCENA
ncbi:MAG: GTPase HflX [Treponema sp.]|nr:GTPase HflX [Treponema sp.]